VHDSAPARPDESSGRHLVNQTTITCARLGLGASALCATLLAAACASKGTAPNYEPVEPATREAPAPLSDYSQAQTGSELAQLVRSDLEQHRPARAYEELDRLAAWSITTQKASTTYAIYHEARLVPLFLHYGGSEYLGSVDTLEGLLKKASGDELAGVYHQLFHEDEAGIGKALDEGNLFGETSLRVFPELRAHAAFFEGVLAYYALEAADPSAAEANAVAASMDQAGESFAHQGLQQEYFLTRVFAGKALEQAELTEQATERWLQAAESAYWDEARDDLRLMIAGRIQSYRDGLEAQIRQDVEASWNEKLQQAQADTRLEVEGEWQKRLAEAESEYREQHAIAAARIDELRGALGEPAGALSGAPGDAPSVSLDAVLDRTTKVVTIADFLMRMCSTPAASQGS
jgi:hypothetical protein